MPLSALEVSNIQSSIAFWERAEYWCIALVALGVIGEEIAELTGWFGKHKKLFDKYSAIVLVMALVFEGICTERANKFSGILISSLNETARGFESQIADANLKTETEHLARIKLEKSLDWRRVSRKQKESIRKSLASIDPAIIVSIHADMRDPETAQFAIDLLEVFRKLGDVSGRGVGNVMSPPSRFGLWIDTFDPSESAARTVKSILTRNGIDVVGIRTGDITGFDSEKEKREVYPQLILYVGFRPTPYGDIESSVK
jgi:hypothetical protein